MATSTLNIPSQNLFADAGMGNKASVVAMLKKFSLFNPK